MTEGRGAMDYYGEGHFPDVPNLKGNIHLSTLLCSGTQHPSTDIGALMSGGRYGHSGLPKSIAKSRV